MASWLEGGTPPTALTSPALQSQVRLQDQVAQSLGRVRHTQGALTLETIQTSAVFEGEALQDLIPDQNNRAHDLIENVMVAANGVAARWLQEKGLASIRRVLRSPAHWDRIVALAAEHGGKAAGGSGSGRAEHIPGAESPVTAGNNLPTFPLRSSSCWVAGEYALEVPGQTVAGHFGLAVRDYMHSTAPNRRYPDVITQRLVKSALSNAPAPYTTAELQDLAAHCTAQEDIAAKVERRVGKSAAALLLQTRIGQTFDAVVTGAADKGTWARTTLPPAEGRIVRGFQGLAVGQAVRVRLLSTDVNRGFIDFAREA